MNFTKAFSTLLLILVLAAVQTAGNTDNLINIGDSWVNSPTVEFAPNGDRTSPYPPYFHPTN